MAKKLTDEKRAELNKMLWSIVNEGQAALDEAQQLGCALEPEEDEWFLFLWFFDEWLRVVARRLRALGTEGALSLATRCDGVADRYEQEEAWLWRDDTEDDDEPTSET